MVKVSVIVPIYNTEKYLEKCIESLINQTLREIEIILIDDGSTDKSYEIARKFESLDKRITVIKQENTGQSGARNRGLEIAKGEYIGFVDSDDWVDENFYEKLYEKIKKEKADLGVASRKMFDKNDKQVAKIQTKDEVGIINNIPKHIVNKVLFNHTVTVCNKIYKKNIIENKKIQFESVNIVGSEDTIFNYAFLLNAKKFIEVSDVFYNGAERIGSTTRKYKEGCIQRTSKLIEKIYLDSKKFENEKIANEVAIIFLLFFQQWNYNFMKIYSGEKISKIVKKEHILVKENKYLKKAEKEVIFNKKTKYYMKQMNYKSKGIIFMKVYFLASYLKLNNLAGKIRSLA